MGSAKILPSGAEESMLKPSSMHGHEDNLLEINIAFNCTRSKLSVKE
jgi:hypothetical protein